MLLGKVWGNGFNTKQTCLIKSVLMSRLNNNFQISTDKLITGDSFCGRWYLNLYFRDNPALNLCALSWSSESLTDTSPVFIHGWK